MAKPANELGADAVSVLAAVLPQTQLTRLDLDCTCCAGSLEALQARRKKTGVEKFACYAASENALAELGSVLWAISSWRCARCP